MKLYILGAIVASLSIPAPQAYAAVAATHDSFTRGLVVSAVAGPATADPADSLYRSARDALTRGDYDRAAQLFHEVGVRYPKSSLLPDAMYYEAFAHYRAGGAASMRTAHNILANLQQRFPDFGRRSDAATLATRICGELAQQGDATCAASIAAQASGTAASSSTARGTASTKCVDEDDDERVAALNALLQMDADRAEPILEKVLARRDECSASLRRKAVFLVAQKQSPQAVDVLLHVAQTDPDADVRGQAVFWLSQVNSDRAVSVLSDILHKSSDQELRDKALFALGQSAGERGTSILRAYASDASQPAALRGKAIFWLGQQKGGVANAQFLRDLYTKLTDDDLRNQTLFAISQGSSPDRAEWLLQLAQRNNESVDNRKRALFLAGQAGASVAQLTRLYDALPPGELREQMIFVFSQSRDPAALDKLISIARTDKDADSRKKAIFWLGQSHDPRAIKAISEVLDK
ncbi:MAG TPA: HEAT repeat domain-containing protein [Gemmatimonadaceae bacterium]|nr:HEAT repeat domain-containing protein [Gemmatimonadaceae bacterium]